MSRLSLHKRYVRVLAVTDTRDVDIWAVVDRSSVNARAVAWSGFAMFARPPGLDGLNRCKRVDQPNRADIRCQKGWIDKWPTNWAGPRPFYYADQAGVLCAISSTRDIPVVATQEPSHALERQRATALGIVRHDGDEHDNAQ